MGSTAPKDKNEAAAMQYLFASLQLRKRPEDIAAVIVDNCANRLTARQRGQLNRIKPRFPSWMSDKFREVVGPTKAIAYADRLFNVQIDPLDPGAISEAVWKEAEVLGGIEIKLPRAHRKKLGLSRRQYLKRLRLLRKLYKKAKSLRWTRDVFRAERVAKSGFACDVDEIDFKQNPYAAFFIAYYTARRNRRSVFTNSRQSRPMDTIAEGFLNRAIDFGGREGLRAISYVYPDVVDKLHDEEKLNLLALWVKEMNCLAVMLKTVFEKLEIQNRQEMVVQKGNDSSTWNALAGAWNSCRQQWISLLYALGKESVLNTYCPGKVMRLIAADVAYWHRITGNEIDPATSVWSELPLPWEVFFGDKECGRAKVANTCHKFGVDPVRSGWTAKPTERIVEEFTPTLDLVHGIAVRDPMAAHLLRKAGIFSGKVLKDVPIPNILVERDENGFVTGASTDTDTNVRR